MMDRLYVKAAGAADIIAIQRLLHAEGLSLSLARIEAELPYAIVLGAGEKLLGVLRAEQPVSAAGQNRAVWLATHPLYRRSPIEGLLGYGLALIGEDSCQRNALRGVRSAALISPSSANVQYGSWVDPAG